MTMLAWGGNGIPIPEDTGTNPAAPTGSCVMNPLILVTNDDGVDSEGILVLAEALRDLGEVCVFAPDRERSAASHSLTLHRPLRIIRKSERVFAVDGTPADCVNIAMYHLDRKPDLLISGINHGENVGTDITYSGTVFGAMEGALQGIRSFAVSLAAPLQPSSGGKSIWDFRPAAQVARRIAEQLIEASIIPPGAILNVNVPALNGTQIKGFRITRQGKRVYQEVVVEKLDPRGLKYYWIGGNGFKQIDIEDSDIHALEAGYVSITPLTLDLTHYQVFEELQGWKL